MGATATTRYSFTAQFLRGAAIFARRAWVLDGDAGISTSEELRSEHVACVVGSLTQATAAIEAEISEITIHGPGHHLGSNGTDVAAREFLRPLAETIDGEPSLRRYDLVLHLLRKPAFDRGANPYQDAALLVRLRNELIHYKSKWGDEMDEQRLFAQLERLQFEKPVFAHPSSNFFPHKCLSPSLASWSVLTGVEFINAFYHRLGVLSPLMAHSEYLRTPPARLSA
ncbi:hypothetical protein V1283_003456 [Bradyrhizobium sp. AZCC 2262]|uniref:hypothetical protein n=1 Tax=Bradyrhizobium sp. AZCC 2262 TaxID=3117022 RepID=UPI002FF256D2